MVAFDLVTVIIPAYNAVATIDETLRSVRSQTHRQLEILVIDDGSTDATASVVLRHASQDARLRLIQQRNGGVAAARNRGVMEARADLIAPIDADDLWSPDKIEKQLMALRKGGEEVALIYTWFALIDENSRIIGLNHRPREEGDVLKQLLRRDFVGNSSSPLMRRNAVLEAGAYDQSLRARSAEGCEDHKLYLRISERFRFSVITEFLTGYRQVPNNMSSNAVQMFRSWEIIANEMRQRCPDLQHDIDIGCEDFLVWLLGRAQGASRWGDVAQLSCTLFLRNPRVAIKVAMTWPARRTLRRMVGAVRDRARGTSDLQAAPAARRFMIGSPDPIIDL